MKYRKKPVEVEAWQFNGTLDGFPEWLWPDEGGLYWEPADGGPCLRVTGLPAVPVGWWFVREGGENAAMGEKRFAATYEPVES